jgi:hypothetical protein
MHSSKRLGDKTEREAVALLRDMFGYDVKRELGAGRAEDCGDLSGMPDLTVQIFGGVSHLVDIGLVRKPEEVERQRVNRGTTFAVTMVRIRGGAFRFVLLPSQFQALYLEAMS